jgi:DNA-binding PadR family transcriptional regulator
MSKGFILFLLTEAVPTVPYEILKMEKKSGTDIWRIHAKSIKYRFVDVTPTFEKIQIS